MAKKTNNGLPSGVSARANRPGLYMLRVMINGQQFTEYYRTAETSKKKLQSELQKVFDAFKERAERGTLKNSDITDKNTFAQAVEWFTEMRKLDIRESTQLADNFIFEHYLIPRLAPYKLREITSPMITKLLAELLEKGGGGGRALYAAREEFIKLMYDTKPKRTDGGFNKVAREINIGKDNTFIRVRYGENCDKEIAEKVAKYYGVPLLTAFEKKTTTKPLSALYVSKITYTLSALFTACVKNGVLFQNPVMNATKPRIGEKDIPAYLDNTQIPIFLDALGELDIDNSIRVSLTLMLMLGLRSGEARGLRWVDVDFNTGIVSIEKNCGDTFDGLALTDLKTKRSRRKLPLSPILHDILIEHNKRLNEYSRSLGSIWQDNGVICPNTTGGLMAKSTPNKAVKRILTARKELPRKLHAHSLRHSFISLLISNGLDLVTVAALAGDTIEIINKHYAHSFAERRAAAMDVVGASFATLTENHVPSKVLLIK
ncbi:MAG: site-specific integrase [Defluviitaleaceae bacterium]|nr:site-specific integrase [Defluviitaleaceae bacterium]